MGKRASLLISCTKEEAREVRKRAKAQGRTLSASILNVVMRGVDFDERIFVEFQRIRPLPPDANKRGPKMAVHLRCSAEEANRIRAAAGRRGSTVSGFMLHLLKAAWSVERERERERESTLLSKLGNKSQEVAYGFILVELDLAFTFLQIAENSGTQLRAELCVENAKKAYRSAKRFLERVALTPRQRIFVKEKLEELGPRVGRGKWKVVEMGVRG
jgi:hypothetical protein